MSSNSKGPEWWETQGEEWKRQPKEPPFMTGDKVVCIDDCFSEEVRDHFTELPVKGCLYVVRCCFEEDIDLVGIYGTYDFRTDTEWGLKSNRFLPLEEYRRRLARERASQEQFRKLKAANKPKKAK